MNLSLMYLEIAVIALALGLLLLDLWTPAQLKVKLGYVAVIGLLVILGCSFSSCISSPQALAFNDMFVNDGLALFFKRLFLIAAIFVILMAMEFSDRFTMGISEFYSLTLLALSGMMFAASSNDLVMVFVSLELITVTFYVLASFQRAKMASLEAGVKYLILGALSSAFLIFGVALIFGTAETTNLTALLKVPATVLSNKVFLLGTLFVLVGLGFKMAMFPFQIWAPDVYQGAPAPVTAFLAIGSKAAGVVLLLRVLFSGIPTVTIQWPVLLMVLSAATILYGNLCAIPQRSLKRLLAYSSIANAGYLLLGFASMSEAGSSAVLYYLAGYLFTLAAAFTVVCLVCRETDDISSVAGLGERAPFAAFALTLAMASLGGIPPLAGFFGKFLLLKAVIEKGAVNTGYYCLAGVTLFGVVISIYYYFGVIRAMYWSKESTSMATVRIPLPIKASLAVCVAGMLYLGLFPESVLIAAKQAVRVFNF